VPFIMITDKAIGNIEAIIAGGTGLMQQFHSGLFRGTAAFAPVAGNAGADYIVPGMLSAPSPRNNVV